MTACFRCTTTNARYASMNNCHWCPWYGTFVSIQLQSTLSNRSFRTGIMVAPTSLLLNANPLLWPSKSLTKRGMVSITTKRGRPVFPELLGISALSLHFWQGRTSFACSWEGPVVSRITVASWQSESSNCVADAFYYRAKFEQTNSEREQSRLWDWTEGVHSCYTHTRT
jgi:hypothetical protein